MDITGALAYAELGTMNTSCGAEYVYFMDAFGPLPAFLFSWVSTLVLKPSQMAIICLSFAKYAVEAFVTECEPPETVVKMVSVLCIRKLLLSYYCILDLEFTCSLLYKVIMKDSPTWLCVPIMAWVFLFGHCSKWNIHKALWVNVD